MALICSILSLLWCLLRLVGTGLHLKDSAIVKNRPRKILNSKLSPALPLKTNKNYLPVYTFEVLDCLIGEDFFTGTTVEAY